MAKVFWSICGFFGVPILAVAGVTCAALLVGAGAATAIAPGDFDASFGAGGKLTAQFGAGASPSTFVHALAVQRDGKLVLAGEASDANGNDQVLVARANPDGGFDSSFGAGGKLIVQLGAGAGPISHAEALAVQGDGKLVLAGFANAANGHNELLVARVNADGSFDSSFGAGGKLLVQLGAGASPFSAATALAVQSDGKLVLAGIASDTNLNDRLLVARLNADGSFDSSFGVAGKLLVQLGAGAIPSTYVNALVVQGDGKLTVAGYASDTAGNKQMLVARVNADGSFDSSFGVAGKLPVQLGAGANPLTEVNALALQGDGKLVLAGRASDASGNDQLLVARVNADGGFDSSFGAGGKLIDQLGAGASPVSRALTLKLQDDGKLTLAGFASDASDHFQLLASRLNPDGSFDSTFGAGGKLLVQLGAGANPFSDTTALATQSDGKLVLAGNARDASSHLHLLVARVIGDPLPSAAFSVSTSHAVAGQAVAFDGSPSSDPDGTISAYSWNLGDGTRANAVKPSHTYLAPGSYTISLTVTDDDLLTATTFETLVVAASPPAISHAGLTNKHFRVAKRDTAISARRRPPLGTSFRFTLSAQANLTIAITRTAAGRRSGPLCTAPTRKLRHRHAKPCMRVLNVGTLARAHEPNGADRVAFSGRIGNRTLTPGSYDALLTATNAGGRSKSVALSFAVVR